MFAPTNTDSINLDEHDLFVIQRSSKEIKHRKTHDENSLKPLKELYQKMLSEQDSLNELGTTREKNGRFDHPQGAVQNLLYTTSEFDIKHTAFKDDTNFDKNELDREIKVEPTEYSTSFDKDRDGRVVDELVFKDRKEKPENTFGTNLTKHSKTHLDKKRYPCKLCAKSFDWLSGLKRHLRTHSEVKLFVCYLCGRGFHAVSNLKRHFKTHTGVKQFFCILCGMRFAEFNGLKNHSRTHSGEKPFSCNLCDKNFAHVSTRSRHLKTHYKNSMQKGNKLTV